MPFLRSGKPNGADRPTSEPGEIFQHLPFPFADGVLPRNLGAVIQRTVLHGNAPAREVVHAADGSWLIGDGVNDTNEPGACVVSHIWHAIDRDRALTELASMQPVHMATRDNPADPLVRHPVPLSRRGVAQSCRSARG